MTVLAASTQDALLANLLLDLALITACALALGATARRIGQPVVVGEIVAGLALGPSLLGLLPGHLDRVLFPADVRPFLQALAGLAAVLFMFGVGYEVDLERLRRSGRDAVRVASASVVVPVVAAAVIAPVLWAAHPPPARGIGEWQFGAFVAIVLSITALPVLARVLSEAGLLDTPLGTLALIAAAITDLAAWVALAGLLATLGVSRSATPIGAVAAALAAFCVLLAVVVRPVLGRLLAGSWCERHGPAGRGLLLLLALALCAAATTRIGLHPAFGAFALGLACPRQRRPLAEDAAITATAYHRPPSNDAGVAAGAVDPRDPTAAAARTLSAAGLVLVPLYFVVTGLNVDVTGLGSRGLLEVAGLLAVATAAKVVGAGWAGARAGLGRGGALGLGLLLNTRGLTELIVLDIGRTAGVIDERSALSSWLRS